MIIRKQVGKYLCFSIQLIIKNNAYNHVNFSSLSIPNDLAFHSLQQINFYQSGVLQSHKKKMMNLLKNCFKRNGSGFHLLTMVFRED